jgi:DNA-directed RNA polymerase specialized sigma24 family protein
MPPSVLEETVLPHLNAAFNYARWLTRKDEDAEDVVQDACVRTRRFFSSLRDDDPRSWLFAIVRSTWYSRLTRRGAIKSATVGHDRRSGRPRTESRDTASLLQRFVRDRAGRFQAANGGTLFLDEVGEIPLELQGKAVKGFARRSRKA